MNKTITDILNSFCGENRISFCSEKAAMFEKLAEMLIEYNSHTNLTAIKDPQGIAVKHFADSLAPLAKDADLISDSAKIIDVGCGAGFPGLPLSIAKDSISVTFIDSTEKKLRFTENVGKELGLDIVCRPGRAEEISREPEMREKFDVAVSRAVANLPVLCELCLPFVKTGGIFIAYKASGADEELEAAKKAIPALGGKYIETKAVSLPECGGEKLSHSLIVIKKVSQTSTKYPRRYAQILKSPL